MNDMLLLMPILSEGENDEAFLEQALKGANNVILLIVVDAHTNEEFGFATSHIQKARTILEQVKANIGKKRKHSEDLLEWGDTQNKVLNVALLRKVDKVVLRKQENHYFEELVKKLRAENLEVEVI
ncbi:MAG: hypothetical protein NUV67_04225 [archaeon]|nr:hypothetical protein [archaeon]